VKEATPRGSKNMGPKTRKEWRKEQVESHWSTPIMNTVRDEEKRDQYLREMSALHMLAKEDGFTLVEWFKERLGRQHYCFTSWRRHWVWEDSLGDWRVYVSNHKGIGFEIRQSLDEDMALLQWRDFLRQCSAERLIGLTDRMLLNRIEATGGPNT